MKFLRHLGHTLLFFLLTAPVHAMQGTPGGQDNWPWTNVLNSLATNGVQIIAASGGVLILVWGVVTTRYDGESGVKRIAGGILIAAVALGAPAIIGEVATLVGAEV